MQTHWITLGAIQGKKSLEVCIKIYVHCIQGYVSYFVLFATKKQNEVSSKKDKQKNSPILCCIEANYLVKEKLTTIRKLKTIKSIGTSPSVYPNTPFGFML